MIVFVRYYDANGRERHRETIEMKGTQLLQENIHHNIVERDLNTCTYGLNMYDLAYQKEHFGSAADMAARAKQESGEPVHDHSSIKSSSLSGCEEMNLLANLIGGNNTAKESKPFKFTLFPDDDKNYDNVNEGEIRMIRIDAAADRKTCRNVVDDFDLKKNKEDKDDEEEEEDDLLALMDTA